MPGEPINLNLNVSKMDSEQDKDDEFAEDDLEMPAAAHPSVV